MNKHSLHIIGPLKSHGVWLGRYGGQIVIYHPVRAQEMIIYYRLMTHHSLPTEKLDQPIVLNPRYLNPRYRVLNTGCNCDVENDGRHTVDKHLENAP